MKHVVIVSICFLPLMAIVLSQNEAKAKPVFLFFYGCMFVG